MVNCYTSFFCFFQQFKPGDKCLIWEQNNIKKLNMQIQGLKVLSNEIFPVRQHTYYKILKYLNMYFKLVVHNFFSYKRTSVTFKLLSNKFNKLLPPCILHNIGIFPSLTLLYFHINKDWFAWAAGREQPDGVSQGKCSVVDSMTSYVDSVFCVIPLSARGGDERSKLLVVLLILLLQ